MNTEDVKAGNKLIADFMGVKIGVEMYSWRPGCIESLKEEHLNYHDSWGWLMPVVEKIGDTRVNPERFMQISIVNGHTRIDGTGDKIFANSSIEGGMLPATYKCVVAFIEWYNKQAPPR